MGQLLLKLYNMIQERTRSFIDKHGQTMLKEG